MWWDNSLQCWYFKGSMCCRRSVGKMNSLMDLRVVNGLCFIQSFSGLIDLFIAQVTFTQHCCLLRFFGHIHTLSEEQAASASCPRTQSWDRTAKLHVSGRRTQEFWTDFLLYRRTADQIFGDLFCNKCKRTFRMTDCTVVIPALS